MLRSRVDRVLIVGSATALVAPPLLTFALARLPPADARAYVFLYLGIVASLGLLAGLVPALIAAALSAVLADYFFLSPVGSLRLGHRGRWRRRRRTASQRHKPPSSAHPNTERHKR